MITITSDSPEPDIWDWNFFTFQEGILSYCIMEYYRILHPGNGTVSHCILRNAGECGVSSWHSSALIEYNNISHAGHELVALNGGSPVIRYNSLGPNPGSKPGNHCGIVIENNTSQTKIYGNNIFGCRDGIVYISGNPTIYDNQVRDCINGFLYINPPSGDFDITDNIFTGNQYDIRKYY
jgi:parallel beta-helix repeat protein